MIDRVRTFTESTNFYNALKVTIASVLPVLLFAQLGHFETGFTIGLGAFLAYPSDIPSILRHKVKGVLVAVLIVAAGNLLVNILHPYPLFLYPVVALIIFFLSLISVYGQRATMVAFSGLLSVSLSFGHIQDGWEILVRAGLLFSGGLFYLLVSLLFHFVSPHRFLEMQLVEATRLTAKYLKLRGDLWNLEAKRSKIIEKQLFLQVELNNIHENIRETLLRGHQDAGNSSQNRKMLLMFVSLVEIMELAVSTSFDHSQMREKFASHPQLINTYQNLAYHLSATLKVVGKNLERRNFKMPDHKLYEMVANLEQMILQYQKETGDTEGAWTLGNLRHYAEKQIEKIMVVERSVSLSVSKQDLKGHDRDLEKFLTPQYYPWETLRENLSFSATHFRYALRLTITFMAAMLIGAFFPLQNVYWILLTLVVIMRPGYGLTKERSIHRIVGTVLGGLIAFGILHFVHNTTVIGALAVLCIMLGLTYTATNYKVGATFVTLYVVFVYGLLTPNIESVIQYRVVDTVLGAALSFAASYLLWPSWEFLNAHVYLKKAILANRTYLSEISDFYNRKGLVTTAYRVARKHAFVEIGNLTSSYQRMSQEPRSKQRQLPQLYKLTILNHSLLSATASLGTYIQSHKTTSASAAFNVVVARVIRNLDQAMDLLDGKFLADATEDQEIEIRFNELRQIRETELKQAHLYDAQTLALKMEEAQLVIEQLLWLTNLSENILKGAAKLRSI